MMGNSIRHSISASVDTGANIEIDIQPENPVKHYTKKANETSFADIVRNNTRYGQLFETQARYEVYVNHTGRHWYLLLRLENSEFPYLTLEIVTTNGEDIQPFVCEQRDDVGKERVTSNQPNAETPEGNMHEFCSLADTFIKDMRRYDVLNKNSQHFCNAILLSLNCSTIKATVGPNIPDGFSVTTNAAVAANVADNDFDHLTTVCDSLPNRCQ